MTETQISARAYTLVEIDAMRDDVRIILGCGSADRRIEERVRTYMMGGVSPEEINTKAIEIATQRLESLELYKKNRREKAALIRKGMPTIDIEEFDKRRAALEEVRKRYAAT